MASSGKEMEESTNHCLPASSNQQFSSSADPRRDCFFCLNSITEVATKTEELEIESQSQPFQFSLRYISRFLKLKDLNISSGSKDEVVVVCEQCSKLTDEFTEIYKVLDITQLRMNWCLTKICEVMQRADNEKENVGHNDNVEKSSATKIKRRTILSGCRKIQEKVSPVVSLKRVWSSRQEKEEPFCEQEAHTSTPSPVAPPPHLPKEADIETMQDASQESNMNPEKPEVLVDCRLDKPNQNAPIPGSSLTPHLEPVEQMEYDAPRQVSAGVSTISRTTEVQPALPLNAECNSQPEFLLPHIDNSDVPPTETLTLTFHETTSFSEEQQPLINNQCADHFPITASQNNLTDSYLLQKNPEPLSSLRQMCDRNPPSTTPTASVTLQCPYCRASLIASEETMAIQQMRLGGHILGCHAECFFPNQKLETVTQTQYQQVLVDLLFQGFCIDGMAPFYCPFCPLAFQYGAGQHWTDHISHVKLHLVHEHKSQLEAKLLDIQRDPLLPEKLRNCNPEGFTCECGVYLSSRVLESGHRLYQCTAVVSNSNGIKISKPMKCTKNPKSTPPTHSLDKSGKEKLKHTYPNSYFKDAISKCPYCKKKVRSLECGNGLRNHLISYHIEHFFANSINGTSEGPTVKFLIKKLFREFIQKSTTACILCPAKFGVPGRDSFTHISISLKDHYLKEHYEWLQDRLKSIQEDFIMSNSNVQLEIEHRQLVPENAECNIGWARVNENSPEERLGQCETNRLNCGVGVNRSSENAFTSQTILHSKNASLPGVVKATRTWMPSPPSTQGHTSNPSTASSLVHDYFSCKYCRKVFQVRSSLNAHITQFHCEHYFPNQKLNTITDLQYKQILVDLLFQEFFNDNMNKFCCPFCNCSFKSAVKANTHKSYYLNQFKLHLIKQHREILEARLQQIQRDPALPEKLRMCNTKGMACKYGCGAYLPDRFSYSAHRKHHCVKVVPGITITSESDGTMKNSKIMETSKGTSTFLSGNGMESEPENWSCERCGYLFFFKELLEAHQKNECLSVLPGTVDLLDYSDQPGSRMINENRDDR